MATMRRFKWHPPPPPPTPRILHLPRRSNRRKMIKSKPDPFFLGHPKGKLERLFDEERSVSNWVPPAVVVLNCDERERREKVEEERESEEKWRFQAEMLRGECKLLRMEREIAVKKLERERSLLEKSLKSAVHTLLSGKKKIREGKNANLVVEEEIEELAKKLIEFQKSSRVKDPPKLQNCTNFDKQASLLQKHLEKLSEMRDEASVKDIQEISGASSSTNDRRQDGRIGSDRRSNRLVDVETLRRKMEGLSKGKLLKRMEEEYGSMLSATANCSVSSSASTSRKYELPDLSSFTARQSSQESKLGETCSGHCKAIVRRIMEQVRAETEQWSQMQEMLGQVRGEMEELQASRDLWEDRALQSDYKIQALQSEVEEWKGKAQSLESKENQLQKQVKELQQELVKQRVDKISDSEVKASRDSAPISLGAQLAKEKRLLSCRLKGRKLTMENRDPRLVDGSDGKKEMNKNGNKVMSSWNRVPFKDIGNVSPLKRQNSRRYVYPLHSYQDS